MNKKRGIILIIVSVVFLIALNYHFLNSAVENFFEESQTTIVERIIDGDTIVVRNDTHVRMLGINTPEKGERFYKEAKENLEKLILNKTVKLEFGDDKVDKYGRTLAFVFLEGKNVNVEQVKEGFANVYILEDKKYETELDNAWNNCIKENKNLCEKSKDKCADCVELEKWNFEKQVISFYNKCDFDCSLEGWTIKDEGRKKFVFSEFDLAKNKNVEIVVGEGTNNENKLFWKNEEYVWTATGDTFFLRDKEGKLVLWGKLK